ncbi:MAG: hypothetical protein MJ003_05685 [Paludibacteraceae bacterium]|nr:hypothetical protein [Paludibacteraceae bacterium]
MDTKVLIFLTLIPLVFASCVQPKRKPSPIVLEEMDDEYSSPYQDDDGEVYYYDSDSKTANGEYFPTEIYVPEYSTIEDAISQDFSLYGEERMLPNLGGMKMVGEMSADVAGRNRSEYSDDYILKVLPLCRLKLSVNKDEGFIYNAVIDGRVEIVDCEIFLGFGYPFNIRIVIRNLSPYEQYISIPQGLMIESTASNVQNVVVGKTYKFTVYPNQTQICNVSAFCASRNRTNPSGTKANITPYILNVPPDAFESQNKIWSSIEETPRYKAVFYAWDRGDRIRNGYSDTGHAFVCLCNDYCLGFGPKNGELLGGEGSISNHRSSVQYATDSCVIYLTNHQMIKALKKVQELTQNTPKYYIGHYDCTSFVMDVADAAGIYYGNRLLIQWPMSFLRSMKKYNCIEKKNSSRTSALGGSNRLRHLIY